jgi:hypothetical protein
MSFQGSAAFCGGESFGIPLFKETSLPAIAAGLNTDAIALKLAFTVYLPGLT